MRLACCQHAVESASDENVERALAAITDAAHRDVDLVCLPEIFNVGYFAFDDYEHEAESLAGPTLSRVADAARDHGVGVLAGSIVEDLAASSRDGFDTPAEQGLANTSVFFDRAGERRAVYRKHHLFGYESREAELLVPGESLGLAEFEGFTLGMTTCYDLRFPELYRELAAAGATLVLVPSAWPYPRVDHWRLLPRARRREPTVRGDVQRLGRVRRDGPLWAVGDIRPVGRGRGGGGRWRVRRRRTDHYHHRHRPRTRGGRARGVPGVPRPAIGNEGVIRRACFLSIAGE
jgi:predicted amidohydrolase